MKQYLAHEFESEDVWVAHGRRPLTRVPRANPRTFFILEMEIGLENRAWQRDGKERILINLLKF
jgi:hypothetical protein